MYMLCMLSAKYMFEEGLLDRQELLQWILELLDKLRSAPSDDGILKLLLPLALQYLEEFVQSELLARRLAYLCCKKIAHMCNNVDTTCSPQSPSVMAVAAVAAAVKSEMNGSKDGLHPPQTAPVVNQLNAVFNDFLNCPHHRDVLYGLSTIVQVN
jgi:mediator of RNA polymerase II transcription subunit 12